LDFIINLNQQRNADHKRKTNLKMLRLFT